MPRTPQSFSAHLHLERELLTIAVSQRSEMEPSAFATSLLNVSKNAPYTEVIDHFVEGNPSEQEARQLWINLLSYRKNMTQSFGERVSLHIAVYHISRDPKYLKDHGLNTNMQPKEQAKQIAILELRAWWERCSQTGTHLSEVIEQQLNRLIDLGSRDDAPVSYALLRISKKHKTGSIAATKRHLISRWLMDSCRCRDLIAQTTDHSFAIVFPHTNRMGALAALRRISKKLPSQLEADEHFSMVLASFPENGTCGRELILMASIAGTEEERSQRGRVKICEGKLSPAYLWWRFSVRRPFLHFIRSPRRIALAAIIVIISTFGTLSLKLNNSTPWVLQYQQALDTGQSFPLWQWGHKYDQGFKLHKEDGFAQASGELVCDSDELWLRVPLKLTGDIKMTLSIKRSLGSTLSFHLGTGLHERSIALEITPEAVRLKQKGVDVIFLPQVLAASITHHIQINLSEDTLSLQVNNQKLAHPALWSASPSWPQYLYYTTSNGSSLLWDLHVYDHSSARPKNFIRSSPKQNLNTEIENDGDLRALSASQISHDLDEARRSASPLKACQQQIGMISNPLEQAHFFKSLFSMDWGASQNGVTHWAWEVTLNNLDHFHEEQQLLLCLLFLNKNDLDSSSHLHKVCTKLLHLGLKAPLLVYQAIESCPVTLAKVASWPNNRNNPVLTLLQARASEKRDQLTTLLQQLKPWIQQTDFGKLMRYDWMWLHLKGNRIISEEQLSLADELRRQNRRPDIARRVQDLVYPPPAQIP